MTVVLLRRRKLGRGSCNGIKSFSSQIGAIVRNDQDFPADTSTVIRWGTTSNVPCNNVVNTAEAIHRVGDKAGFRELLMDHHMAGNSLLCPWTFGQSQMHPENQDGPAWPVVVRPRVHAQGKHVYLCSDYEELSAAIAKCGPGWYASSFINKVAEYRVTFVSGRVVWVAKKTPGNPDAVAWNVALGGRFDNVRWDEWPLRAVKAAREAFLLSGLDFGAVDVMVDAENKPYILEINSAPSQTSPYRQECLAKGLDYLLVHGKGNLPVTTEKGGWKKFIHPALTVEAVGVV